MTERVVYSVKVCQVCKNQSDFCPAAFCTAHDDGQLVVEQASVRQSGQLVVICQMHDTPFGIFSGRDVIMDGDKVR